MTATANDALAPLAAAIRKGLPAPEGGVRKLLEALFGSRYHTKHLEKTVPRDALGLGDGEDGVPFAGLIHPDNPPSGPYGGTSIAFFPTHHHGSILTFVVGTRGLSPDEGILTRPGHRRRVAALRRFLARLGIEAWTKPDPCALGVSVPKTARDQFPGFEKTFQRYGQEIYCIAKVPDDEVRGRSVVQAFFDLYAYERGWQVLKAHDCEYQALLAKLRSDLFSRIDGRQLNDLIRRRRFVVLQGPPGTGKTRLAEEVRSHFFSGRGFTVQFHPAVTYEDFVVGLFPNPQYDGLRFDVRPGWLLQAARESSGGPYLMIIDEVNRADLGKILGEAIYLFEADEVGGDRARHVRLPHPVDGQTTFCLPDNLYVLATMNTADRSIASMDLAVRRRFAFVTIPPDRDVISSQGLPLATAMFDRLCDVFIEHAPEEAIDLLPGHAYFLAQDEMNLRSRFQFELLPLLDEYLRRGFLGAASTELSAVRDAIEDAIGAGGQSR